MAYIFSPQDWKNGKRLRHLLPLYLLDNHLVPITNQWLPQQLNVSALFQVGTTYFVRHSTYSVRNLILLEPKDLAQLFCGTTLDFSGLDTHV